MYKICLTKEDKVSIISMKSITGGKSMKKEKFVGISKVGEKGQIVIPKEARDMFNIEPGDSIIVLCDKKKGIALIKSEAIEDVADDILNRSVDND
jgi:AbrB family looped-hinge helix DNA binding protein